MLSQGSEGEDEVSIVVNDEIIGIESLQILSILIVGEEIPGLNVITTALMIEEWIRADIKQLQTVNKRLPLTMLEDVENFFSILFTGGMTTQTENNLIVMEAYQTWLSNIKQQFLANAGYDVAVVPLPDVVVTQEERTDGLVVSRGVSYELQNYNIQNNILECSTTTTTISNTVTREGPSFAEIVSFHTPDDTISRLFKGEEVNVIGAPSNSDAIQKGSSDVTNIFYPNIRYCPKNKLYKITGTIFSTNNGHTPPTIIAYTPAQKIPALPIFVENSKALNSYEGFVGIAKSASVPSVPKVLVVAGNPESKVAISACDSTYTIMLKPENKLSDICIPEGADSALILTKGRKLTLDESLQTSAKLIVGTTGSDIIMTKKVTVSLADGSITVSPSNPGNIQVPGKPNASLEIKYINNNKDTLVISFEHDLEDLLKAHYDEISKKLTLTLSNNQQVVITKFDLSNNPILLFQDFNVQLGKHGTTGAINGLDITLETGDKLPTAIFNEAKELITNEKFSNNFQYTLSARNEKLYLFGTNKDTPQLVHGVADKENYVLFSSNIRSIPNKIVIL